MPPLLIDIPQMIDLALGTPEIGVVNFTVLHSLLHAMTEILNLDKYRVEFRGNQGVKIEKLIHHIPLLPIVTVQEFNVESSTSEDQKVVRRTPVAKKKTDKYERILVIRKTDEIDDEGGSISSRVRRSVQQPVQIVSQDDFRKLDPRRGTSIHDPIGRYLPNNQEVFDSARGESEDSRNPVGEMWHTLNVIKRVDATEIAIEKLTSMMRDVSDEYRKLKNAMDRVSAMSDISHLADKIDILEKMIHDHFSKQSSDRRGGKSTERTAGGGGSPPSTGGAASKHQTIQSSQATDARTGTVAAGSNVGQQPPERRTAHDSHASTTTEKGGVVRESGPHESDPAITPRHSGADDLYDDFYELKNEVEKLKGTVEQILGYPKNSEASQNLTTAVTGPSQMIPGVAGKTPGDTRDLGRRMELLENKLNTIEHQIFDLEKEFAELVDRFEDEDRPNAGLNADVTGIADIYAKVTGMKTDLDTTMDRCNFLIVERDQIVENIESISKKIEEFKNVKVDKDEIDELLAEKADYNMLQRKVSVDQFDATKRHLTNGLVEALDKLTEQSKNWQSAFDEIRTMTEDKVGRDELNPLKEYVDSKIHALQERLKALAALRRDPEAAGTRSKYLRQVNCISCDQDVIMRIDEPSGVTRSEAMPAPSSLKPFLVYELDSIRKQMKDPNTRNLHHFETMTKEKPQLMADGRARKPANRYCGGSHTILTPQDRVQRCKFNKKLIPTECFIKTNEGCYYKAMKKECICSDKKEQQEKVQDLRSGTSSKPEIRSEGAASDRQPKAEVIKQITSIRSSKSEMLKESPTVSGRGSYRSVKSREGIQAVRSLLGGEEAEAEVFDLVTSEIPDEAAAEEQAVDEQNAEAEVADEMQPEGAQPRGSVAGQSQARGSVAGQSQPRGSLVGQSLAGETQPRGSLVGQSPAGETQPRGSQAGQSQVRLSHAEEEQTRRLSQTGEAHTGQTQGAEAQITDSPPAEGHLVEKQAEEEVNIATKVGDEITEQQQMDEVQVEPPKRASQGSFATSKTSVMGTQQQPDAILEEMPEKDVDNGQEE